jgi:hypothetical protein
MKNLMPYDWKKLPAFTKIPELMQMHKEGFLKDIELVPLPDGKFYPVFKFDGIPDRDYPDIEIDPKWANSHGDDRINKIISSYDSSQGHIGLYPIEFPEYRERVKESRTVTMADLPSLPYYSILIKLGFKNVSEAPTKAAPFTVRMKSPENSEYSVNAEGYVREKGANGFIYRGKPIVTKEDLDFGLGKILDAYSRAVLGEFIPRPSPKHVVLMRDALISGDKSAIARFIPLGLNKAIEQRDKEIKHAENLSEKGREYAISRTESEFLSKVKGIFQNSSRLKMDPALVEKGLEDFCKFIQSDEYDNLLGLLSDIRKMAPDFFNRIKKYIGNGEDTGDLLAQAGDWGF